MGKSIIIFFTTFILLSVTFITEIFSQATSCVLKGDSLMAAAGYEEALIQYSRCLFMENSSDEINLLLLKKAQALKMTGNFQKASEVLKQADFSVMNDSLHFIFRQQISLNAYLNGDFNEAISQITQCKFYITDSAYYKSLLPILILSLNELYRYDEAKRKAVEYAEWLEYKGLDTGIIKKEIVRIYQKKNIPVLKKPEKAETLSAILPGLGHFYAGYPEEALLSFTLVGGSLAAGIYGFYKKYYFTGYFVGLSLFQKFYFGGIRRAHQLAEKHNALKTSAFNKQIRLILLK